MIFFNGIFLLERFKGFLTLKIDFENQILALFDIYFWPFNKSHEKINAIFVISATTASIWNVFIKFRWHDDITTCGGQPTVLGVLVTHDIGHQIVTALTGSGSWTRQGCDVDGGLKICQKRKIYKIKTFQTSRKLLLSVE